METGYEPSGLLGEDGRVCRTYEGNQPEERMSLPDVLVLKFDVEELAVLILEGITGTNRPAGQSAHECLTGAGPEINGRALHAAESAYNFFVVEMNRQGLFTQKARVQ